MAVLSLDPEVGDIGEKHVREGIGQDGDPVPRYIDTAQQHVNQRCGQEDKPRPSIEEVNSRVEIAEPLRPLQPMHEEWILSAQNLDHPARPAHPLSYMAGEAFC